mmetsp:Transcript_9571/g.16792  ORF Transcript_9571/g.16792 Transcript_9571/m.16792 type:complete len:206 (+) Transcript_9571:149-766(+)
MSLSSMSWGEMIRELLEQHEVKDPLADLLLWHKPAVTAMWLGAGIALYILVDVFEIGVTTTIGSIAILQLLVYRISSFLQQRNMAFEEIDLKETLVLTPQPENVAKTIEIIGHLFRLVEESINELSLSSDYFRLGQAFSVFLFLSTLGRVVALPMLLVVSWVAFFTLPATYVRNQDAIDDILDKSLEATEVLVNSAQKKKEARLR